MPAFIFDTETHSATAPKLVEAAKHEALACLSVAQSDIAKVIR